MSASGNDSLLHIQHWFQTVISHPGGAEEGILSPLAQQGFAIEPSQAESVVRPSSALTALERLSIYAGAYHARLLECMGNCYPVLKRALGEDLFNSFALEYLEQFPSRSYTLDSLGEHFARFLMETRPALEDGAGDAAWPDFLIDLATLEWNIGRVFDGPGGENQPMLTPESLQDFPAERFGAAHLTPVAGFRLLSFRFPVSAYHSAVRHAGEKEEVPVPDPVPEHIAMFRRDYVVRRYPQSQPQFALLEKLAAGASVAEAIAAAASASQTEDDSFAVELRSWFRFWAANGFFSAITA